MVGRTRFIGDVLYSIGVSGFIYPIFGHWCWGPDGFLATMGSEGHFLPSLGMNFHDFAGSTVVHSIGGWVAIAGAICLGPRLGRKFKRDGGGPMLPHDLTIAVVGGLILWFGWYGFNPCSTLSIMDIAGVGRVAMNTTLAACTGGLAAVFVDVLHGRRSGTRPPSSTASSPAWWRSPAPATGSATSAPASSARWRACSSSWRWNCSSTSASTIRSAPGRFTACAASGARCRWVCSPAASTRRPARARPACPRSCPSSPEALTGLFYGGGMKVLDGAVRRQPDRLHRNLRQRDGDVRALNALNLLRVSKEGELKGLDIDQHGISAYPEYQTFPERRQYPERARNSGRRAHNSGLK